MRLLILFLTIFILTQTIIAQSGFEKTIVEPELQTIYDIEEDNNHNLIMVGRIIDEASTLGYMIRMSENGTIIDKKHYPFDEGEYSLFYNVYCTNNSYVVLGNIGNDSTNKLLMLNLNQQLDVINDIRLNLPAGKWISYLNSIVDSDGNFVLTGYTGESVDDQMVSDPFYYKISPSGDSITSNFPQEESFLARTYDIMEKPDHSGYYAFSSYLDEGETTGSMVALSEDFEVEEIMSIPMFSFNYYSPIRYGNSIIINTNGENDTSGEADLNVMKIDTNANLMDNRWVGKQGDTADYPSYIHSTSRADLNSFYITGTANLIEYDPFYGNGNSSWILLGKYNTDLDEQWLKYYGGDAYYHVYSMTTTSDHGCAVVATRFDPENPETDRDIYVMKVNDDGIITWDQAIEPSNEAVTVFPNPGSHSIHIDTETHSFIFRLYDAMGKRVLQSSNRKTIDVSRLEAGMYFYRVISHGEIIGSGKWVKQ
ncbi:MAG: T9SS type A sorting domain-containing protein [Bacteroidales bacterium]|nr:T9SS type A sorting domain-containing protein [Bacteroidales bacterium]